MVTADLTFEIIGTSRFCHARWTKEAFHLLIFCFINFDLDTKRLKPLQDIYR